MAQALSGINLRLALLTRQSTAGTKDLHRRIAATQHMVQQSVNIRSPLRPGSAPGGPGRSWAGSGPALALEDRGGGRWSKDRVLVHPGRRVPRTHGQNRALSGFPGSTHQHCPACPSHQGHNPSHLSRRSGAHDDR
ncbi:MAG: hypothetical protein ACOYOL_12190 [Chthoniobacterales bacterium]